MQFLGAYNLRLDRVGGGADDGGLRQLAAPQQPALRPPRPVSGRGPRFSFNLDNTNNYTPDTIIEVVQKYFSQNEYFF